MGALQQDFKENPPKRTVWPNKHWHIHCEELEKRTFLEGASCSSLPSWKSGERWAGVACGVPPLMMKREKGCCKMKEEEAESCVVKYLCVHTDTRADTQRHTCTHAQVTPAHTGTQRHICRHRHTCTRTQVTPAHTDTHAHIDTCARMYMHTRTGHTCTHAHTNRTYMYT